MNELFWLVVAILFALFQSRDVRGDRRRTIETWLRNLLGVGVGVRYLVSFLLIVPTLFAGDQTLQTVISMINITSLFFAFAVGGLLCLYRKIFWFATSVIFSLWSLPLSTVGLIVGLLAGESLINIITIAVAGVLLPILILVLMGYYYLQYVRVAR
jgi:hypothetical protein